VSQRQSAASLEYVNVRVTAKLVKTAYNPTTKPVDMAFVSTSSSPADDDWNTAEWETVDGEYIAKCLVGPTGTRSLDPGTYAVYVRVTDDPEVPVIYAGVLEVY
jgi:hypothetical protein